MSATPTNEEEVEIPSEEGVGPRLRKAREALDLSRAEIAAGLYLKESVIAALEDDDREALPGPVFVQGYIRKYARFLDIPEGPLLEEYNQQTTPHKRHKKNEGPLAGSPIRPEISSKHAIVRLITWAIVLGLLALLAIWWQGDMPRLMGQSEEEQPAVSQEEAPAHAFAPEIEKSDAFSLTEKTDAIDQEMLSQESTTLEEATLSESETETKPEAAALNDQQIESIQDEPAVGNAPIEVGGNGSVDAEAPLTPEAPVPTGEGATAQEPDALPEEANEIASIADTPRADVVEQRASAPIDYANSIVIEFSEACWTEIKGANDSYKLVGNMQEGERRVLGGEPPYTFLLGNSAGVTLTIKGERFDIEAYSKANIARFTLQAEDIPAL